MGGGHVTLSVLHKSSGGIRIELHAENKLPGGLGSGLKVWVGWVMVGVNLV